MIKLAKKITSLCILASTASLTGCGGEDVETNTDITGIDVTSPVSDWQMVWNDEFDGTEINADNWTHEDTCAPPNTTERQCYSPDAEYSYVEDGVLKIVALPTPDADNGKEYTSARMNTRYKADHKYGRFEMRAKLPSGQGSWPAFWMKATDDVYGAWPHSGEIDIMETVNLNVADADGKLETEVRGVLHYGEWNNGSSDSTGHGYDIPGNPVDDFHTYAVEWQEGEIRWYVDDVLFQTQRKSEIRYNGKGDAVGLSHQGWYARYFDNTTGELTNYWDNAPYDQDFFIILNHAVGGNHPETKNDLGVDASAFHSENAFEIDYVRVYQCSLNPDTGKGCATIGTGLSNELVAGAAPNPPLPPAPPSDNVTITMNANWAAWFSNGDTPEVVTDAEQGEVDEFSTGAASTVAGFTTRDEFITDPAGETTPHNASAIIATGSVSFDMKLITPPNNADASWTFKIESDGGETAVSLPITDSVQGAAPTVGQWQSYTFPLQTLFDAGLDVSAIDVIMIYPGWSSGEGAVYRIANLEIGDGSAAASAEVVLFDNAENPSWVMWNSTGDVTPFVATDEDDAHGDVVEFEIADNAVTGFTSRPDKLTDPALAAPFDATSIVANGVMQFDMKVVNMPSDSSTVWYFKAESVDAATNAKIALSESIEGSAPTANQWQTYTFKLSDLEAAGLDLSSIDVFLIYPNWGQGAGTVYRVDNAKVYDPTASGDFAGHVLFGDQAEAPWSLWNCCNDEEPTLENDDTDHGITAEFIDTAANLGGLRIADDGVYLDVSDVLANGVVQFEMKVIDPITTEGGYWQIKMESGDKSADKTFKLTESIEGVEPVTGQWQTYTYTLQSFFDAGIDVSQIDIVLISANWGGGAGVKYRLDNVMIYDPSSLPVPATQGLVIYDNAVNSEWPNWASCNCTPTTEEADDDSHGNAIEFVGTSAGTVFGFKAGDGVYYDASADMAANGVFQFDFKLVTAPTDAGAVFGIKVESGDAATNVKFNLTDSQEGVAPVVGEWQTYTYSLQDLFNAGLDVSEIDVVMVYPGYGASAGSVFRMDNVVIKAL